MSFAGIDRSGNNNHFTSSGGLDANDQMLDSPTNNFATFNSAVRNERATFSEGNLKATAVDWTNGMSTFYVNSGKYYYETVLLSEHSMVGISNEEFGKQAAYESYFWNLNQVAAWSYYASNGYTYEASVQTTDLGTATTDDIIGVAVNLDTGKMWFAKNGTWLGSGDPAAGTNASISGLASDYYSLSTSFYTAGGIINYGADSSFAGAKTSQGNQDSNDIGDFYYTPPTDFLALCTSNLPAVAVIPSEHFNTILFDDGAGAKTGVGFQPDLVWLKSRGSAYEHELTDAVRGVTKAISSDSGNIESTDSTGLTAFGADGFTVGADTNYCDTTGDGMVAWNWKAGTSGSGTTTGLGTGKAYSYSVNTTAGFSIIKYEGNGTGGHTIPHHLGATADFVIVKCLENTEATQVISKAMAADHFIQLTSTTAQLSQGTYNMFNSTRPSTTVVTLGTLAHTNQDNLDYIMYAFAEKEGYSKVGSYTGNGDADGTFIYTGFRPAFIICKKSSDTSDWIINDTTRDTYNNTSKRLFTNVTDAESGTYDSMDILSNGFKMRNTNSINISGASYIFLAFAETPFKYSNAR